MKTNPRPRTRATRTRITMTLQGRRAGTACWNSDLARGPSNCRKPALERLARHSLFGRYMKAQLRLAGDRRKLGRNGFSSDIPRECVDPPRISAQPAQPSAIIGRNPRTAGEHARRDATPDCAADGCRATASRAGGREVTSDGVSRRQRLLSPPRARDDSVFCCDCHTGSYATSHAV